MNNLVRVALLSFACASTLAGCDWFVSDEEHIARAEKFLAGGEERAAAIELQNVLSSKPGNVRARLLLAQVSLRQGDARAAQQELQRAIQDHAPAAEVAVLGAEIQLAKGEYDALLAALARGDARFDVTQATIYRGLALLGTRDVEGARQAFSAALASRPDSVRARLGLRSKPSSQASRGERPLSGHAPFDGLVSSGTLTKGAAESEKPSGARRRSG